MSARAPAALVLLSAVPLVVGALRLVQLTGGPAVIPADDRFAGFPAALAEWVIRRPGRRPRRRRAAALTRRTPAGALT